jgi:hypothetical protein
MKWIHNTLRNSAALLVMACVLNAQQQPTGSPWTAVVPRLVNFSGRAIDAQGKTISGIVGITFAIYKDQSEGSPLWLETQSVQADAKGNYTVQLGATEAEGLPLELFSSGEARWLGVRIDGGAEQPRVLLLSVPYALKAADAETVGGLPPSAFVLAAPPAGNGTAAASAPSGAPAATTPSAPPPASTVTTTGGTANTLAMFTGASTIGNSILTQASTTAINVGGKLILSPTGTATASKGYNSYANYYVASAFNSGTGKAITEKFLLQTEPVNNNTTTPTGSLHLLFGSGSGVPAETGLHISSAGIMTFASGQTFPGAGTVKSVGFTAPNSDFRVSGSPVTASGTLGLTWNVAPTSAATANAIVKRDSDGSFSAGPITATTTTTSAPAVLAYDNSSSGHEAVSGISQYGSGVVGSGGPNGVTGYGSGSGVSGQANSTGGTGVVGYGTTGVAGWGDTGSTGVGVWGYANEGVYGGGQIGVYGQGVTTSSIGVFGTAPTGVSGDGTTGVAGYGTSNGVYAQAGSGGWALNAYNTSDGTGVLAGSYSGYAAWFNGDVEVDGQLSKSSGSFKIDHPLDPANKYLYHSFVESPDMMNIYNGNVTTDAQGDAVVSLPRWFEALNRDFRYQLTVIGQFAQAIVSSEIANSRFSIKTDKPNVKVSWQVTGIRQDAWANAHRIPVEEAKPESERGFYLHPELYGAPEEKGILWARYPENMKSWQQGPPKVAAAKGKRGPPEPERKQ